jgi:DnaJ-domain-containing protein 1
VTQEQSRDRSPQRLRQELGTRATYYGWLDLPSTATAEQIRQAYRQKSKLYHPDTTVLHSDVAAQKFNEINEAYAVLSSPEHRTQYDLRLATAEAYRPMIKAPSAATGRTKPVSVGHLDPKERPLSPGEMFALFILGLTFAVCLALALILGIARGEMILQTSLPTAMQSSPTSQPLQASPTVSSMKSAIME